MLKRDFLRLLITFENNWDSDQDLQNANPDPGSKLFDTLIMLKFLKEFFEKVNLEKVSRGHQEHEK